MKNMLFLILLFITLGISAQENALEKGLNSINEKMIKAQLEFLASDWTMGRETTTAGAYLASDYIASIFTYTGLEPGGDFEWTDVSWAERRAGKKSEKYRTYFQNFPLIQNCPGENHRLKIIKPGKLSEECLEFEFETDFDFNQTALPGLSFEAPMVFVGYGFVDEEENFNDYRGLDVEGKVLIRLNGYPGMGDSNSVAYKKFSNKPGMSYYRMYQEKNKEALKRGAIAVIEIPYYGKVPSSWVKTESERFNLPYYEGDTKLGSMYDCSLSLMEDTLTKDLLRIEVSKRLFNYLLEGSSLDLEKYREEAASRLRSASSNIPGLRISFSAETNTELLNARNVLGVIEGKRKNEIIVIGAHYDHLGKYDGYIWNGADDNASGTVGVMSLARAMMASGVQPEKTLVFACWTGEEKGLLGSRYFVENPYGDTLEHIILNLNFDMISRNATNDTAGNQCYMSYSDNKPVLKEIAEKSLEELDTDLEYQFWPSAGGRGGSDHAPFSMKGIPFCFYITGMHEDYHQPTDHTDKVNYAKMTRIVRSAYLSLWELANTDWNRD